MQMEYTSELRHFHLDKKFHHFGAPTSLKLGDLVLLSPNAPFKTAPTLRSKTWENAKVVRIHRGRDNLIRAVDVQIIKDGKLTQILTRPIQAVSPLEVIQEEDEDDASTVSEVQIKQSEMQQLPSVPEDKKKCISSEKVETSTHRYPLRSKKYQNGIQK
jgi:hypothetical protein